MMDNTSIEKALRQSVNKLFEKAIYSQNVVKKYRRNIHPKSTKYSSVLNSAPGTGNKKQHGPHSLSSSSEISKIGRLHSEQTDPASVSDGFSENVSQCNASLSPDMGSEFTVPSSPAVYAGCSVPVSSTSSPACTVPTSVETCVGSFSTDLKKEKRSDSHNRLPAKSQSPDKHVQDVSLSNDSLTVTDAHIFPLDEEQTDLEKNFMEVRDMLPVPCESSGAGCESVRVGAVVKPVTNDAGKCQFICVPVGQCN